MAKKNETVARNILEGALKLEEGFNPIAYFDYSEYPEIEKFVNDYNKAHPHLAVEFMNDTDKYIDKLKKADFELTKKILERTNQFKEFYEVSCMYHGIITFYMTLCQMFTIKIEDLQEKLDRYENND